ncbi:hypothetical protein ISU10_18775 [Nocardioides agariphilus]|jgi:hypothetical protein|uniref:Uncharacterized protein n=1 Tax=Nocardioides agariphilus TaxID=433664 RepID=A0A930VLQ8_9ACTN|nr:DUF6054 family protein [Nocardioides agariphilus]MBF4769819.1 hypothetical protein [Nocardioides agariphilus]
MAHYEHVLRGDVDSFVAHLDSTIPAGSISASLEDRADQRIGDARMVVRMYERYSALGGNRVSLCISVLAVGDEMSVSAITAGGSQAVFWKLNTVGESTFLQRGVDAILSFPR